MAKIKTKDKTIKVKNNSGIIKECEELGVPFSCEDGACGTCLIEIEEGMENLNEKTQPEKNMGINRNYRLACQCKIKSGEVKIIP